MAKTFLRCYSPECNKLLMTKQLKEQGCCECGGQKFRGVNEGAVFSEEEQKMISLGLAHYVDTSIPGADPDDLNYDNEKYWERVAQEVSVEDYNRRRGLAARRLGRA